METKFLKISYKTGQNKEEIGYIIKEFIDNNTTYYLVVETLYKPCEILIIHPRWVLKFHSYWHI
jgi:hypothetical protein